MAQIVFLFSNEEGKHRNSRGAEDAAFLQGDRMLPAGGLAVPSLWGSAAQNKSGTSAYYR